MSSWWSWRPKVWTGSGTSGGSVWESAVAAGNELATWRNLFALIILRALLSDGILNFLLLVLLIFAVGVVVLAGIALGASAVAVHAAAGALGAFAGNAGNAGRVEVRVVASPLLPRLLPPFTARLTAVLSPVGAAAFDNDDAPTPRTSKSLSSLPKSG